MNNWDWVSVDDRLPKTIDLRISRVITVNKEGLVTEGMYNSLVGEFLCSDFSPVDVPVTHWMPLPEPPK